MKTRARPRPHLLSDEAAGLLAMSLTVLIWSGFALSMRALDGAHLSAIDLALIRFGLPAVLFAPCLASRWPRLRRIHPFDAALILVGGGLPFFFLTARGAAETSAAQVGRSSRAARPSRWRC